MRFSLKKTYWEGNLLEMKSEELQLSKGKPLAPSVGWLLVTRFQRDILYIKIDQCLLVWAMKFKIGLWGKYVGGNVDWNVDCEHSQKKYFGRMKFKK